MRKPATTASMGAEPAKGPVQSKSPPFEAASSRQLGSWLFDHAISIAFTTYQANMLFFLAGSPNGRWTVHHDLAPAL